MKILTCEKCCSRQINQVISKENYGDSAFNFLSRSVFPLTGLHPESETRIIG
jgi:hypothetical protein